MASANPPRPSAPAASASAPRALRLLERAEPLPLRQPPPPTWSARLGRWVDRLLVS